MVVIVVGNVGDGGLVWYAKLFAVGGGDHIVWGWMAAANMVGKGLLLELVLLLLGGRTAGTGAAGAGRPGASLGRPGQVQLVQGLARRIGGGLGEGRGYVLLVLQVRQT